MTFIAAKLEDNPALTTADPSYRSKLMALPDVERERLLEGNWDARPSAGKYIQPEYMVRRWAAAVDPDDDSQDPQAPLAPPVPLNIYISSDYAVTERVAGKDPDFTEHGVVGIDDSGLWYVLDWWFGQTHSDVWVTSLIDLIVKWDPLIAFGEAGLIGKAVEPMLIHSMEERGVYCDLRWVSTYAGQPSATNEGYADPSKRAKARRGRSFQARAAMGKVLWPPNAPWVERVTGMLVGFPSARYDDAFDVMANLGLGVDEAYGASAAPEPKPTGRRDPWEERKQKSGWKTA
jgi:hypothetical protein